MRKQIGMSLLFWLTVSLKVYERLQSSDDFLRDLTDQECKELKDALTVAFVKWAHDTGNPHWIDVPIEGTEHLYDLKTGRRVE